MNLFMYTKKEQNYIRKMAFLMNVKEKLFFNIVHDMAICFKVNIYDAVHIVCNGIYK